MEIKIIVGDVIIFRGGGGTNGNEYLVHERNRRNIHLC